MFLPVWAFLKKIYDNPMFSIKIINKWNMGKHLIRILGIEMIYLKHAL